MERLERRSLHDVLRIAPLPDWIELYPTHGAGSLCGTGIGGKRWSTIGFERRHNPALGQPDADAFTRFILEDQPSVPAHWRHMRPINQAGATPMADLAVRLDHAPLCSFTFDDCPASALTVAAIFSIAAASLTTAAASSAATTSALRIVNSLSGEVDVYFNPCSRIGELMKSAFPHCRTSQTVAPGACPFYDVRGT